MAMARPMKIAKQSIKLTKPSNPTPPTLTRYKLGFIDEFLFAVDVGVVLSFSVNNPNLVARLENSLEKTLTRFYPLAGRYVEEIQTIDCSDQGVPFMHANANIKLEDFHVSDVNKYIDDFFPSKVEALNSLLAVQVTKFECGGVALAISGLHKILDASTLCIFINEWAAINREENNETEFTGPGFNSSLLFPARGLTSLPVQHLTEAMLSKYTRKKLVFTTSVISNLKAKGNNTSRRWSKVQLVSAIIWGTFMKADLVDSRRESALIQPVNLRGRMISLIPKDSCGNVFGLCVTKCKTLETTEELVERLTDSMKSTIGNFAKAHHDSEEGQAIVLNSLSNMTDLPPSTHVVIVSSWCKFPFYEVDFGFGKPFWVAPWTIPRNHLTYLMDDVEGNGVEAYICVHEKLEHENEVLFDDVFLLVDGVGIKPGDTYRHYHEGYCEGDVFNILKQRISNGDDRLEVCGCFILCSGYRSVPPDADRSAFLKNLPGVTYGGDVCSAVIARGCLTSQESAEQELARACLDEYGAVYFIMSYAPP